MAVRTDTFDLDNRLDGTPVARINVTFDETTLAVSGVSGTIRGAQIDGLSDYLGATNKLKEVYTPIQPPRGIQYIYNFENVSVMAGGTQYNLTPLSDAVAPPSFFGNGTTITASDGFRSEAVDNNPPGGFRTNVCFASGTLIETTRGEVAVEDLRVGDLAVTASGERRAIRWLGHRRLEAGGAVLPTNAQPVRIAAGAFDGGLPRRPLYLSPGHPVLVGADADGVSGVLVPVMCLENGTSIAREPRAEVTYWHVELDTHDILLAEGLAAESYIDGGDRTFFTEASDHALHNPDFIAPGWDGRCRPVAVDGPVVEAERLRLDAVFAGSLAAQCKWPTLSL